MKPLLQLLFGLAAALGMIVLVMAALLLSVSEDRQEVASFVATPQPSPTASSASTSTPAAPMIVTGTPRPTQTGLPTQEPTSTQTRTPTQTLTPPALCPPPEGWVEYTVETGDNLILLSMRVGVPVEQLQQANCLLSPSLLPGTILYLPPATPTPTHAVFTATASPSPAAPTETPSLTLANTRAPVPCGHPYGWIVYTVQPNDTLYHIAQSYDLTVNELMFFNCLSTTLIKPGMKLYVPNIPTHAPTATKTPEPTDTEQPTRTPSPTELPTSTFTETPVPTEPVAPTETFTEPAPTTAVPTKPAATTVVPTATTAAPPKPTATTAAPTVKPSPTTPPVATPTSTP